MEKILITGGAGFIGIHLTRKILSEGYKVSVIDNFETSDRSNIELFLRDKSYNFTFGDIRNDSIMDKLCKEADYIIHLAAAVGVQIIVDNPLHVLETNIFGTEKVFQYALKHSKPVMITSTSEVYGKGIKVPFSEDDDVVLGPTKYARWAYGASKMVDEFLGLAYYEKYNHPVKIIRLFNTVGPGQSGQYGMVIPRFIQQALKNKPITVYGSGNQARCFCDVTDVCNAIWLLFKNDNCIGQIFNIGGIEEISMIDLAKKIKELSGSISDIVKTPYAEAYGPGFEDMDRRFPDINKIKKYTGWKPKATLEDILLNTIEFEKKKL